ncbi:MAG TPA: hypothetical protein VFA77_00840, partial [Candidatus Eisenbacteria bacterium]|nr:hypothetical protein [Candidatus Eisenbacteria bacterium]
MISLRLHGFHRGLDACFAEVNGLEAVAHYGDWISEYSALHETAGVIDLSFRGRVCLTGNDRQRFLNGQVTNNVKDLPPGQGCYAALTTAKGKMQSDLNIYCLPDELLLDFEPGLTETIAARLDKYIIADDVQVVDVAADYGLLSVQGPSAEEVLKKFGVGDLPDMPMNFTTMNNATLGEMYFMNNARTGTRGWDCFIPTSTLAAAADRLIAATKEVGGRANGWQAMETARIEAGIPRFGIDMDESNFPPETGIEERAVSYSKGCYIG